MKIRKGDLVKIRIGKDRGRQGKVLKVLPREGKVVVEGINKFKKHVKGDGRDKESAIVDVVRPLQVSNVMLICPSCNKTTRVGFKVEGKSKSRICKKCNKTFGEKPKTATAKKSTAKKSATKKSTTKKSTTKKTAKSTKSTAKKTTSKKKTTTKKTTKSKTKK